ncbi:MAG: sigma-54-dependent Fis family transcriptional regulator [Elusimicrobia bacterium]|nr:sigma-54-dependent Fis family transcriptional regulator [Elusimicrobiota bacterium]
MEKPRILLAEDDASLSALMAMDLKRRGYEVVSARNGREAGQKVSSQPYDAVVTDLRIGVPDGLEILRIAKLSQPETQVILITGHGSIDSAVAAMKSGAFDYMIKPIEPDELAIVIDKAIEHRRLLGEVRRLREVVKGKYSFDNIVYASPQIRNVLDLVQKVASTDATVLVLGESGTGKELVARAIHEKSARRNGAFVAINCGALPEGLLESELFGHVKGAFTGADRNKRGLFEEASGGTLFLDEISETSPSLQVKLLRALQDGEVRRVGDNHPIKVSGRLVTASNKDLAKMVEEGRFRDDLYYRLKVFPISIPPLRERPEDIMPLAEHFLRNARKKNGGRAARFSPKAAQALKGYRWPGNVRELEHAMERALIMTTAASIEPEDLPPEILAPSAARPAPAGVVERLSEMERRHIAEALKSCGHNLPEAARKLGIPRPALARKMKAYRIPAKAS